MHADAFVEMLQSLGRKILAARPAAYPQPITRSARTWAAIYRIDPPPSQPVQDDIADLMTRYYISPAVIREFSFVRPQFGVRRVLFLVFKAPDRKPINLFVDTFEHQVYQAAHNGDEQMPIGQLSPAFLDCLGSYAYFLSHCTTQNLSNLSQLRLLQDDFLTRIHTIPGSDWWQQTVMRRESNE